MKNNIEIICETMGIRIKYSSGSVTYGSQMFVPHVAVKELNEKLAQIFHDLREEGKV